MMLTLSRFFPVPMFSSYRAAPRGQEPRLMASLWLQFRGRVLACHTWLRQPT